MRGRRTIAGSLALIILIGGVVAFGAARIAPTRDARPTAAGTGIASLSPSPAMTRPTFTATPQATTATPTSAPATATAPPTPLPTANPTRLPMTATPALVRPTPSAQPTPTAVPTRTAERAGGVQAIRARDLPEPSSVTLLVLGGDAVHLDDTRAVYPASTVKLAIYLTLAHRIRTGEAGIAWETPITVRAEDVVGGTGVLQTMVGSTHTAREVARLMIVESDNVAANLLLGRLGGGQGTDREHVRASAVIVTEYVDALGIRGMVVRHGLLDPEAFTTGTPSETTSDALAQLLLLTLNGRGTLDGAADVLTLLGERGTHNPWHPGEAVDCGLTVERIGGIYPATADRPGVRLDVLHVTTPGSATRYLLAVAVPTTAATDATVEPRIARFEGDMEYLLTGHWAQCVDSVTRQQ